MWYYVIFIHSSYFSRYKICYFGSDGTDEVELEFFEEAGIEFIGKASLNLIC
jgi:hypothetical protein